MNTAPPRPAAHTVYTLDVELGGNRTLRCALDTGPEGPDRLHLAIGYGTGTEWREDRTATVGEGCTLPVEAIGPLRAALCALVLEAKEHHAAGDGSRPHTPAPHAA
jgi:hypothetical protein